MVRTKCPQCGKPCPPRGKFCSARCYHQASKLAKDQTCKQCGRSFQILGTRIRKYCSRKCYLIARTPGTITKMCPVCEREFTVPLPHEDRFTHCSRKCRIAFTTYIPCERCGKRFRASRRGDRRYCSEECRRPPITFPCKTCGTIIRRCPGNTTRQFCSFACYRRHRGENALECSVRKALKSLRLRYNQEAKVGRYSVDFLLPGRRIALEVDGAYWHRDMTRDRRKDIYLQRHGWHVARLPESLVKSIGPVHAVRAVLSLNEQIPLL